MENKKIVIKRSKSTNETYLRRLRAGVLTAGPDRDENVPDFNETTEVEDSTLNNVLPEEPVVEEPVVEEPVVEEPVVEEPVVEEPVVEEPVVEEPVVEEPVEVEPVVEEPVVEEPVVEEPVVEEPVVEEPVVEEPVVEEPVVDEAVLAEDKALMEELQREQVSAIEVKDIVSDEVTKHLIEKEEDAEKIYGNKKAIINLDVISRSFEANDVVTVNTLKEKHLIAKNVYFVKVLARGVIDKPLVIKAQDFSIDAAKMIQLTGGKVVMLTKRKYF